MSGDYPVCMQIGYANPNTGDNAPRSYLDYPSLAHAERDGAFVLRQDIRLLSNLFEVGIHEYASLAAQGLFDPAKIDHFLCHYSSEKFSGMVERLMHDSGLAIPRERWYSNLSWRGNTGAAAIFIMLADFMREKQPQVGERILCFVPESGRFTIACMLLTVTEGETSSALSTGARVEIAEEIIAPPHSPAPVPSAHPTDMGPGFKVAPTAGTNSRKQTLLRELAQVWHRYRSRAWRTLLVRRILAGELTRSEYLQWMSCWIPQVREGSRWMGEAAGNVTDPFLALAPLIERAASDERLDYTILFEDYRNAGGTVEHIDALERNPGGDALNAYMHGAASGSNPVGLLGGIYIIEGTGQRIIPHLLPKLRRCPEIPSNSLRFLHYHGENDIAHLERWLDAVELALDATPESWVAEAILQTASDTAELYLMQMRLSVRE